MIRSQVSCIPLRGDKIAVIRKNNVKSTTHMYWIPAGGHVELGETLEEACVRELKEETGLTIKDPRMKGIVSFIGDNGYHSICTFFLDDQVEGSIEITEDNIEAEWLAVDEILDRDDVTSYHAYIYRKILTEKSFFNISLKFTFDNPEVELIEHHI